MKTPHPRATDAPSRGIKFPISIARVRFAFCLAAAVFLVLLSGTAAQAQDVVRLPGILPDTDKHSFEQSNDAFLWSYYAAGVLLVHRPDLWALSIPQDTNGNMIQDSGEDWSETKEGIDGFWTVEHDNSCWAAAANNLFQYATGVSAYHSWMYLEGVPTPLSGLGGRSYWYSGGDFPTECLDFENVAWHDNWSQALYTGFYFNNPEDWVANELKRGKPVVASVAWSSSVGTTEGGHSFAVYGIDLVDHRLWIVNSDSDNNGDKPYWIDFQWWEGPSGIGGSFVIDWDGDGNWSIIRGFDALESMVWGVPDGGNLASDNWLNTQTGTRVYEVSSLVQNRPCVVRVIDAGRHQDCLLMGFNNQLNSPTTLIIETAGEFSVQRFMMRDTTLDISGQFYVGDQQGLDGLVNLRPGGNWQCPYGTTFVGTQADALVDQTGGSALMWSVILGYEPNVKGTYYLMDGTLKYGELVIGDEGRGELGMATGTQVLRNTESYGALYQDSFDPDTSFVMLGRAATGRGQVYMDPGSSLETNRLVVGYLGVGNFEQRGGTVSVLGDLVLGEMAERVSIIPDIINRSIGGYVLKGDGVLQTERTLVGGDGDGTFTHSGTAVHETQELILGSGTFGLAHPSHGNYYLTGGQLSADRMVVGDWGQGTYLQSGGLAIIREVRIGDGYDGSQMGLSGGALFAETLTMMWGQLELSESAGLVVNGPVDLRGTIRQDGDSRFAAGSLDLGGDYSETWYYLSGGRLSVVNNEAVPQAMSTVHFNQYDGEHLVGGTLTLGGRNSTYYLGSGTLQADRAVFGYSNSSHVAVEQVGGTAQFGQSLELGHNPAAWGEYDLVGGEILVRDGTFHVGLEGAGTLRMGRDGNTTEATVVADLLSIGVFGDVQTAGDPALNTLRINRLDTVDATAISFGGNLQLGHTGGAAGSRIELQDLALTVADLKVGYEADSQLSFSSGSSLSSSGDLTLGWGALTRGDLGIGGLTSVGGDMYVGRSGVGQVDHDASRLVVGGDLVLGDLADSSGIFNANSSSGQPGVSDLEAKSLVVGRHGLGTFTQTAGGVEILNDITIGQYRHGPGQKYEMQAGVLRAAGSMVVGQEGNGRFTQVGGDVLLGGSLFLGLREGGEGEFYIDNGSFKAGAISVGEAGTGTFTQAGGTAEFVDAFQVSPTDGQTGLATLQGGQLTTSLLVVGQAVASSGRFDWRGGALLADRIDIYRNSIMTVGQDWPYGVSWNLPGAMMLEGSLIATDHTLVMATSAERTMNASTSVLTAGGVRLGDLGEAPALFSQSGGLADIGLLEVGGAEIGGGRYILSDGTLTAGMLDIGGGARASEFQWHGGVLDAGQIHIGANGRMTVARPWTFSHQIHVDGGDLVAVGQDGLTITNPEWDWENPPRLTVSAGTAQLEQLSLSFITEFVQDGGTTNLVGDMTATSARAAVSGGTLRACNLYVNSQSCYEQSGGSANLDNLLVGQSGSGYASLSGDAVLTTVDSRIGIAAYGELIQTGGRHVVSETLSVGEARGTEEGNSRYKLSGDGVLITSRSHVGTAGWAEFHQDGGLHQITTSLDIGPVNDPELSHQAFGTYTMTGGRLEVPEINLGVLDTSSQAADWSRGEFYLRGGELHTQVVNAFRNGWFCTYTDRALAGLAMNLYEGGGVYHENRLNMVDSTIAMHGGEWYGEDLLQLQATGLNSTTFEGHGYVELLGGIENRGRVIADGFGQDRTLDLSMTVGVVGTAENTGHWGWFAQNQGALLYPNITLSGDGLYTVGDDPAGARLELINSVRVAFTGVSGGEEGAFAGSLLATDRTDIPLSDALFIGVWDFVLPEEMTFASATLTFRYDDLLLADLGLSESDLRVFHLDGAFWTDVTGGLDMASHSIYTRGVDSFSIYAVGTVPEPATLSLLALGLGALAVRRRRRS